MAGVEGRVALVTGAGSADGIGFATAKLFRATGAKVAITSTTERIYKRLEESALIEEIANALGPIDIVVNNAGMVQVGRDEPSTPLHETTDKGWRYGIDINLTSAFLVMDRNYGRIVQMSSVTGPVVGIPGSAVYGAAKAGMLGMARSLAIEAGPHNVTVNCIGPGWIKTASSSEDEVVAGRYTPAGRPGTPAEVGHVAVFLASEEASYVTGQLIVVDGGNTIQESKVALEGRY
jgi:3-oxoacyl-[acyl-carrier protein] reductase